MQEIRITIEKYKENNLDLKFCSYSNVIMAFSFKFSIYLYWMQLNF